MQITAHKKQIALNVREVARSPFSALSGLRGGLEAKAAIGRQVHEEVTAGASLREEFIQYDIDCGEWTARISGRIDGIEIQLDGWVVREIKTRFDALGKSGPRLEERRQLEGYLVLLRLKHPELGLRGELVEVQAATREQRIHPVEVPDLDPWIETVVRPWVEYAATVVAHRDRRSQLTISFPHEEQRQAQKAIARAVQDAYEDGLPLMLSAPTGSGKTAAVLTEALRLAVASGRQVLWLTAKTPQQALPLELAKGLSPELRVVQLASKQRLCLNETVFCHPAACTYLRKEPEKMEAAWPAIVDSPRWTIRRAKALGREHEICPHLLGKRQIDLADLVIADFNYAFGPDSLLPQVTDKQRAQRWVIVVDEAHNLAERARDYFTAQLPFSDDSRIPTPLPLHLARSTDTLLGLLKQLETQHLAQADPKELREVLIPPETAKELDSAGLEMACDVLMAVGSVELPLLQQLLFFTDEVRDFAKLAAIPTHAQKTIVLPGRRPALKSICLDASSWLAERHQLFHHAIFMSATLHPTEYFQHHLGLPGAMDRTIESDFDRANRQVLIVPSISTVYHQRQAGLPRLVEELGALADACPGRVAVFFPSFSYLNDAAKALPAKLPIVKQQSGQGLKALQKKIISFQQEPKGLFLAVTAGLMGEGVDFGDGGIQALAIVGPALPSMSGEANLRRDYYESTGQDGFLWTFACPGMQRVIQAAGRLIRKQEDRGQIVLIGQRFTRSPYRYLIPPDWEPIVTRDLHQAVRAFWHPELDLEPQPPPFQEITLASLRQSPQE